MSLIRDNYYSSFPRFAKLRDPIEMPVSNVAEEM